MKPSTRIFIGAALVAIEDGAYGDYVGALNDAHALLTEALVEEDSRKTCVVVFSQPRDPDAQELSVISRVLLGFHQTEILPGVMSVMGDEDIVRDIVDHDEETKTKWVVGQEGRLDLLINTGLEPSAP